MHVFNLFSGKGQRGWVPLTAAVFYVSEHAGSQTTHGWEILKVMQLMDKVLWQCK